LVVLFVVLFVIVLVPLLAPIIAERVEVLAPVSFFNVAFRHPRWSPLSLGNGCSKTQNLSLARLSSCEPLSLVPVSVGVLPASPAATRRAGFAGRDGHWVVAQLRLRHGVFFASEGQALVQVQSGKNQGPVICILVSLPLSPASSLALL
jgi:hypothetical protein